MRRTTEHDRQLKNTDSFGNGRLRGEGAWRKYPLFWFHLFLSYKCTRRCNFCYVFNQVGKDGKDMEMDENTFARLLEWIPAVWRANNVEVNSLVFLGGEPLLRTDRIKKVMASVKEKTGGMQASLYTNGDLVDAVNWDDLEDIRWITVNVSDLDTEELARRMKIIARRSNVAGQTIAVTLDDSNLGRILELARFGLENGYRLRYQRDIFRVADVEYRKELLKRYHELCDLLESYAARGYDVHTTFLLDALIPGWDLDLSPYPCGKRSAVVFPDGSIGPCIRDHSFKTGTIFAGDPLQKLQCAVYHYDITAPDLPAECAECAYRVVCQGGCPHDKLLITGTRSGKSVLCGVHKEIIPRLAALEKMKGAF